jgi:small subunit ribosomal protein S15
MPVYLPKEKIQEIFETYNGEKTSTGGVKGQIALFTYRINSLSEHLKSFKQDHSCRRALVNLVGKRRSLLDYLYRKDIVAYRELIVKLGIRK